MGYFFLKDSKVNLVNVLYVIYHITKFFYILKIDLRVSMNCWPDPRVFQSPLHTWFVCGMAVGVSSYSWEHLQWGVDIGKTSEVLQQQKIIFFGSPHFSKNISYAVIFFYKSILSCFFLGWYYSICLILNFINVLVFALDWELMVTMIIV